MTRRNAARRRPAVVIAVAAVAATLLVVLGRPTPPTLAEERTGDQDVAARLAELAGDGAHAELTAAVVTPDGTRYAGLGADLDTEVEIGSVTKTMTALLLAQAVERGEVALDDLASDAAGRGSAAFTLEDLATHRSGLPRLEPGVGALIGTVVANLRASDPYTSDPDEVVDAALAADATPGDDVEYSNLGVAALGQIVAERAGQPYERLLEERVLGPLGMSATSAPVGGVADDAPRGHTASGRVADPWTLAGSAPAGGVRSTAADMARYAEAMLRGDAALGVGPGAVLDGRASSGDGQEIGLAWFVDADDPDGPITWHNGGTGGYSSMLLLDRERGIAVFVAGNTAASVDDIAAGLLADERESAS